MSDSDRGDGNQDIVQGFVLLTIIFLCCLIVAVVTHSWSLYDTNSDQRAAYYQAEAEKNQKAICIAREGGLLAECLEEQRKASLEAYTTEQDLNAQKNMAYWALWMFIVSAITAGLTMWALWYVRGTLRATRDALKDTGNATNAMIDQNRISERIGEAQARAYLSFESAEAVMYEPGQIQIAFTLHNSGNSPAHEIEVFIIAVVRESIINLDGSLRNKTNKIRYSDFLSIPDVSANSIHSQPLSTKLELTISDADIEWLRGVDIYFALSGHDVFGKEIVHFGRLFRFFTGLPISAWTQDQSVRHSMLHSGGLEQRDSGGIEQRASPGDWFPLSEFRTQGSKLHQRQRDTNDLARNH